jgi:hypothetical protein
MSRVHWRATAVALTGATILAAAALRLASGALQAAGIPSSQYQDSFEADPAVALPGASAETLRWQFANKVIWDETQAHAGKHSVRLGGVEGYNYLVSQSLPAEAGDFIEISAWVKTLRAVGNNQVIVRFNNDLQGELAGGGDIAATAPEGTRDWTLIKGRGRLRADARSFMVFVMARDNATGTCWFDDVEIRRIPAAEAPVSEQYPAAPVPAPNTTSSALQNQAATPATAIPRLGKADDWEVITDAFEVDPTTPQPEAPATTLRYSLAGPMTWDDKVAHTGKHSLRLGGVDGYNYLMSQTIPVAAGDEIELRMWVKTENATGSIQPLLRSCGQANGTGDGGFRDIEAVHPYHEAMQVSTQPPSTSDWVLIGGHARVPESAANKFVTLFLMCQNNKGNLWIDDVEIRRIPGAKVPKAAVQKPTRPRVLKPEDYVTVKDGHLSYRGKRLRVWSAQGGLASGSQGGNDRGSTQLDIDREVDRFISHGFNGYRTIGWDNEVDDRYLPGDGSFQDLKDYLLAALGAKGVFVWMDMLNSCQIRPDKVGAVADGASADAWKAAVTQMGSPTIRACLPAVFDPRIKKLYHDYIARMMAHRNQHNGLTYGEDPVFFCWELTNEDWWVARVLWGGHLELPRYFQEQFSTAWNAWLKKKYRSDEALAKAWSGLLPGESIEQKSVSLLPLLKSTQSEAISKALGLGVTFAKQTYGPGDFSKERGRDVVQFLCDSVAAAKAKAYAAVRAAGKPGLGCNVVPVIYDTGYSGSPLTLYQESGGDATAHSCYLDMSTHDGQEPTFPFASGLRKPPQINNWLDGRTVVGKPAFMYEVMTFNPQKYRLEAIYNLLANAAIQDLDVVSFHYYGHALPNLWMDGNFGGRVLPYMTGGRNWDGVMMRTDEVLMSAVKLCGEVFKNGYLVPAEKPTVVTLGRDSMFDLGRFEGGGEGYGLESGFTTYHHGFRWAFNPAVKEDQVQGELINEAKAKQIEVNSPTRQITYRPKEGTLVFDDAHMKAVVGFGGEQQKFTDGVTFRDIRVINPPKMPFAIEGERYIGIGMASLDGRPLAQARTILVSAMSTSANSGLTIDVARMQQDKDYCFGLARSITSPGSLPVLVARVAVTIDAPWLTGRKYRMLDFNHRTIAAGTIAGGQLAIPADKPAYLIEILND